MKKLSLLFCFISTICFGQNIGIRTNSFDKVSAGDSLGGINFYRITATCNDFNFSKPYTVFNNITNAGKFVVQNFNWTSKTPASFCSDISTYTAKLSSFLTLYKPDLLVIENEETNRNYYIDCIENYIRLLTSATITAHQFGVKITNGGLTIRVLTWLIYRDFTSRGLTNRAAKWATKCIPDVELRALQHPGTNYDMESKISDAKKLILAYKNIDLDYVNIHWYEPVKYRNTSTPEDIVDADTISTSGALQTIVHYLYKQTGKKIISNEMGQMNESGTLVTSMLTDGKKAGLQYIIWQDITGTEGANNNQSVALIPFGANGKAFKAFITSLKN